MQLRLPIEAIGSMLKAGNFKVTWHSDNMMEAFKDFNNGQIHMKLKRKNSKYSLQDHFYWVTNFHYEHGIRPARIFESNLIRDFAEKYIIPYQMQRIDV